MSIYIYRAWEDPIHQHFGVNAEDLLLPLTLTTLHKKLNQRASQNKAGQAVVRTGIEGDFHVNVDVYQFRPEDITVKVVERSIILEAKHEERQDEHGYISRQFIRKYVLPEGYDIDKVSCFLSSDGVLTLTAPKMAAPKTKEKVIPVIHTGPHSAAEKEKSPAMQEKKKE